ncbi:MAG: tetratricopeptide repeat protein [Salinivirgaceae bacterium]|nr:tetratricopeptide repeat protein [Salinivirgaceae bacterium]
MKKILIYLLLLGLAKSSFSTNIDSLKNLLQSSAPKEIISIQLKIAEIYAISNYDSALIYCNQIILNAEEAKNNIAKAKALKIMGNVYFRKGELQETINYYSKSLEIFEKEHVYTEIAKIHNNFGFLYQKLGNNLRAISHLEKALKVYIDTQNELLQTGPLNNLGLIYFRSGDYHLASDNFYKAYLIAQKFNETEVLINTSINLGALYVEWGKYIEALKYYNQAIDYSYESNNLDAISTAKLNIGIIYEELGNYSTAINYILESLEIRKSIDAKGRIASSLIKLGDIYQAWGKYQISLDYYFEAIEFAKETKDKFSHGNALAGIATVYYKTDLYKKALDYFFEAIILFEEINSKKEIAEANSHIGYIYSTKINDYKTAENHFQIAETIFNTLDSKAKLADLYYFMAIHFLTKKEFQKAISYSKKSINLLPQNNYHLQNNYLLLSEVYKKLKRNTECINALEKAIVYKDSVSKNEAVLLMTKFEIKYKMQQKEKEISDLTKQSVISDLEIKKKKTARNMFIGFSILLALLLLISLYFFRKLINVNKKLTTQQLKNETQKNDLQKANSELIDSKNKAEKLSAFKSQFLANISHEIRTPLNAITGYAKLISKNLIKETNRHHINHVIQASENMMVIINDLLDFSRIEAGKMVIDSIEFKPIEIISQTISTLKFRSDEKKIKLEVHIDPLVPSSVIGDPYRLSQILINLVNNAIKFSEKGQIISIETASERNNDNCILTFKVVDNGIGITESKLESIFESFTQAHSDTSRNHIGTGLGLAIVKRLIELQNGKITVKSKVNKGSEFQFYIPYKINVLKNEYKKNTLATNSPTKPKSIEKYILLVEDNEINQELAKDTILSWNEKFIVDIAENGKEALELMQSKVYDVILMDIQMPVMDGHEATQYIRTSLPKPKCNTPIIGMTAHAMSSEKELALKNGMNEYIIKPFNPDELKQKIFSFIKKNI